MPFRTLRKERHAIRAVVLAGAPAGVAPKPSILGGLTQERRISFAKFVTLLRFHTAWVESRPFTFETLPATVTPAWAELTPLGAAGPA